MPDGLWNAVLGTGAPAINVLCAEYERPDDPAARFPGRVPAVALAGQEKAFEWLGHNWLAEVLKRWELL
eukprot:11167724-Lingulodinium_polyedra.AAC.1